MYVPRKQGGKYGTNGSLRERVGQTPKNGGSKPTAKPVGWWVSVLYVRTCTCTASASKRMLLQTSSFFTDAEQKMVGLLWVLVE